MKPTIFTAAGLMGLMGVLVGCVNDTGTNEKQPKPSIAYVSLAIDTLDVPTSHAANSTGGPVAHYAIEPALPAGLTLDSTSGLISGTPSAVSAETEYWVIATGPGGRDTAALSLEVIAAEATISVALGLKAAPGYQISRVILSWISSVGTDSVVRDTLLPGENGLSASATSDQSVLKSYSVKAPRSWQAKVSVFDAKDSLLYYDSLFATHILVGETHPVTLILQPRYSTYIVKFVLPDSIRAAVSSIAHVLNVNRVRTAVDGRAFVDSVKASGYFTPVLIHTLALPYVSNVVSHNFQVQVFGVISDWPASSPLYSGTLVVSSVDTTYTPTLPWTGPGSPSDPNAGPSGNNVQGLTVSVSKLSLVSFEPTFPGEVLVKRNKP